MFLSRALARSLRMFALPWEVDFVELCSPVRLTRGFTHLRMHSSQQVLCMMSDAEVPKHLFSVSGEPVREYGDVHDDMCMAHCSVRSFFGCHVDLG